MEKHILNRRTSRRYAYGVASTPRIVRPEGVK
jgi:hypothetical protein